MKHLFILICITLLATGCAAIDPLGSPKLQERDQDATLSSDFSVKAGVICRDLTGEASTQGVSGQAQGGRCQEVGDEELKGCFKYNSGRLTYESPACTD